MTNNCIHGFPEDWSCATSTHIRTHKIGCPSCMAEHIATQAATIEELEAELEKESFYARKQKALRLEVKAERDALVEAARELWLNAELDVDISAVDTADLKALTVLIGESDA